MVTNDLYVLSKIYWLQCSPITVTLIVKNNFMTKYCDAIQQYLYHIEKILNS